MEDDKEKYKIPNSVMQRYFIFLKLEKAFLENTFKAYKRDLIVLEDFLVYSKIDYKEVTLENLQKLAAEIDKFCKKNVCCARS